MFNIGMHQGIMFYTGLKKVQYVKFTLFKLGTVYVIPNIGELSPIMPLPTQNCGLPGSGH